MELLGASFFPSLVQKYPGLTLFAGMTLILGALHEIRILTDVLTLLIGHFRGELAGNARAFGRLGGALSNGKHSASAPPHDDYEHAIRRHERRLARRVAWLRRKTNVFHRPWRRFTPHRSKDVLH